MIEIRVFNRVKRIFYVTFLKVNAGFWCFKMYNFWTQHYIVINYYFVPQFIFM